MPLKNAVILVKPTVSGVTNPLLAIGLFIVAIFVSDENHVASAVIFWEPPSEKIPIAMNCIGIPTPLVGFIGDIAIDFNPDETNDKFVLPENVPKVAVIEVSVANLAVRYPWLLIKLFGSDQITEEVMSNWVPSSKIASALYCCCVPTYIL